MLCCIFQDRSRVLLGRDNWFKHGILILRRKDYFNAAGSLLDHPDFSWRKFALQFTPLLGNWLRLTKETKKIPEILSETTDCLNIIHDICELIHNDICVLLSCSIFNNLEGFVEYLKDFSEEDHHDLYVLPNMQPPQKKNCRLYL